jgi:hypothetical protein
VHFLEDQALPAKSENAQTKTFTKQMSASWLLDHVKKMNLTEGWQSSSQILDLTVSMWSWWDIEIRCWWSKANNVIIKLETRRRIWTLKGEKNKQHGDEGQSPGRNSKIALQQTPTLHEEKNTGCCSLVSKAGMTTDVRAVLKCGSPGKYLLRILSRPLALYFGPLRALKLRRLSLNGPLWIIFICTKQKPTYKMFSWFWMIHPTSFSSGSNSWSRAASCHHQVP